MRSTIIALILFSCTSVSISYKVDILPEVSQTPALSQDSTFYVYKYNTYNYSNRISLERAYTVINHQTQFKKVPKEFHHYDSSTVGYYNLKYRFMPYHYTIGHGKYISQQPYQFEEIRQKALAMGANVIILMGGTVSEDYLQEISRTYVGTSVYGNMQYKKYNIEYEKRYQTVGYQYSFELARFDELLPENKRLTPAQVEAYKAEKDQKLTYTCNQEGEQRLKDSKGFIEVFTCKDKKREGAYTLYYPGGKKVRTLGNFKNGFRDGTFEYYGKSGFYQYEEVFSRGIKTKEFSKPIKVKSLDELPDECSFLQTVEIEKGKDEKEEITLDEDCKRHGKTIFYEKKNLCRDKFEEKTSLQNQCKNHGGIDVSILYRAKVDSYTHGKKDAFSYEYYPDGKIFIENFINPDTGDGSLTKYFYSEKGTLKEIYLYQNGKARGPTKFLNNIWQK